MTGASRSKGSRRAHQRATNPIRPWHTLAYPGRTPAFCKLASVVATAMISPDQSFSATDLSQDKSIGIIDMQNDARDATDSHIDRISQTVATHDQAAAALRQTAANSSEAPWRRPPDKSQWKRGLDLQTSPHARLLRRAWNDTPAGG